MFTPDFRRTVNSAAWTIVPIKIIDELLMSALGQKQALRHLQPMSALPPKADMRSADRRVRFVPKADIQATVEYDCTRKGAQVRGASQ
jgi:hypothetical protein